MNRKHLLLLFILFAVPAIVKAQTPKYINYDWENSPKLHTLSSKEATFDELVLKEKQSVEFIFEGENELVEYKLFHKITRVNSNTAIENNNKIYIPAYLGGQFIMHKARVISPKGKVVTLSEKDIKQAEEKDVIYRFFALEGLETGSEIEHIYLLKRAPRYTGIKETFQSAFYKKNIEFEIISPSNLHFLSKSYNGFPELQKDTTTTDKNILYAKLDSLPLLKEEKQSSYLTNLQSIIYKIGSNSINNNNDIITYGNISENIYKNLMAPSESGEQKKLKKLIDQIDLKSAGNEEERIKNIEFYVKSNIAVIDNNAKGLDDINIILDKKTANKEGIVKLFAAIFNQLKIDYQIVLTCNRSQLKFDREFQAYLFLTDYLIYLPATKMYMEPANRFTCLGFANPNFTHNYGLFIKEVNLGSYVTGIGKVGFIEALPYDKTYHNLDIDITFDEDVVNPEITIVNNFGGYFAQYFQPYYSFYSEDEKVKMNTMLMENYFPELKSSDISIENAGQEYFGRKPFIVKSTIKDENIVQKAGDKYLFKIGEVIGQQMEMYQEEERKTEVENDFNRLYHRTITMKLPEGYKIANPSILNMDIFQEGDGERVTTFTSKYSLTGNTCVIDINEYYKKINFSKSEFESFRKVVNAAADFNKLTIILEKI